METREWALLIFTILAQLSVGMLLTLLIVRAVAVKKLGEEKAAQLTELPFYVLAPAMVLAMISSLFHLGKLANVFGAVPNLATSWMSREVVFGVAFTGLVVVFAFLLWRNLLSTTLRLTVGWLGAVVGLGLVYCMSLTYMLPAQPAWNSLATPFNFYIASLLLGVLGCAVMLLVNAIKLGNTDIDAFVKSTLQSIAIAGIILLGLQFLILPLYLAFLSTQGAAALQSLKLMFNEYGVLLAIRIVLVFAGAGVLATYLFKKASLAESNRTLATLTYSAFALVLIGEIVARFIFYATAYRLGV